MNRREEAEAAFRKAVELKPDLAAGYHNFGILLADKLNRPEEAEAAYRKAIQLKPDDAAAYTNLGVLLASKLNRPEEAEGAYRKAIELDPNTPRQYRRLSLFLRLQKRASEALPFLEKWLEIEPNNFDPILALASVNKKLKNTVKSKKFAQQVRSLINPDDWYSLVCLESVSGNADAAFEHLSRATQIGGFDRSWAWKDPDLEWIRDDPRFTKIVGAPPP